MSCCAGRVSLEIDQVLYIGDRAYNFSLLDPCYAHFSLVLRRLDIAKSFGEYPSLSSERFIADCTFIRCSARSFSYSLMSLIYMYSLLFPFSTLSSLSLRLFSSHIPYTRSHGIQYINYSDIYAYVVGEFPLTWCFFIASSGEKYSYSKETRWKIIASCEYVSFTVHRGRP